MLYFSDLPVWLTLVFHFQIVTQPVPFPEGKHAAVNVIGLCGSIGHVLLEQHPKRKKPQKAISIPKLVLLSARHEPGLFKIIEKVLPVQNLFMCFPQRDN